MARKHSPSSSVAVSPRPGGNWKALKKVSIIGTFALPHLKLSVKATRAPVLQYRY